MTLSSALDRVADEQPELPAIVSADRSFTYRELRDRSKQIALGLEAIGVRHGDAVGILAENCGDWAAILFGIAELGAVAVGVNTQYTAPEVADVLHHADVRVLIAVAPGRDGDRLCGIVQDVVRRAEQGLMPELKSVVLKSVGGVRGALEWDSILERRLTGTSRRARVNDQSSAAIVYTSGSMGTPKAVVLRHSNLVRNGIAIGQAYGLGTGDRVWSHFPFFFSGGLCTFLLGGVLVGATLLVQEGFEVGAALGAIQSGTCTTVHAWPNVIRRLIDDPQFAPERVASVRKGTWPVDLWFGPAGFPNLHGNNLYGLTETCTLFTCTDRTDADDIRRDTNGRPFPGNQVLIVDETGAPCAVGQAGEIRLKGFSVMKGYHKRPASAAFDANGYLLTTDIGELREDGRLIWHGRNDDMIRTNGINVSPIEVETVLESIDSVQRAAVTSLPDERRGQRVVALISLDARSGLDEETLLLLARRRLANYKVPRDIRIVPASRVPVTGSGKLDRRLLRDLARETFDE